MERLMNRFSIILLCLLFLTLIFNVFTVTRLPIRETAFLTMKWTQLAALFVFGFYLIKRKGISAKLTWFYIGITLFASTYIFISLFHAEAEMTGLLNILLVLLFVVGLAQIKWESDQIIPFAYISVALILLFFTQWIMEGYPSFQFQSIIRNPNIFGVFVAVLLYFPMAGFSSSSKVQKSLFSIGFLAGILLIYTSSARSALLLILIGLGARVIAKFSKKIFNSLFYIVMLFNFSFVLIYGWLYEKQFMVTFNDWFLELTGKRFFSGRQEIWEPALGFGLEKPFLGHFVGIVPRDYIPGTHYVHAHNQYVQIFLESGLIGLGCFVLFLFGIWKVFQRHLDSELVIWSACFYLGILFYQSFEISLFFNMQAIGLIQWLIIVIGLGAVHNQKNSIKY